ncbi:MAG: hypothetical protein JWM86_2725 [Thermoleophilia bacterium]|nr:hypothetical protein [Thermoleophilia bacterium]
MHDALAPHPASPLHALRARACARERAFTVVEMVVVLVIVLILGCIAFLTLGSSKTAVRGGEAKAAGSAYQQGIAQWQTFSANRNPAAADFAGSRGPKGLDGRPVMASVPEGVNEGRVLFTTTGNCGTAVSAPTGGVAAHTSVVSYCPGTAPNFAIRVITRKGSSSQWTAAEGAKVCWLGVAPVGQPRC